MPKLPLKYQGFTRTRRMLAGLGFILPVIIGAAVGYFLVLGQPGLLKYTLLSLTARLLLTTVVEEIIPKAHKEEDARPTALMLVGGFPLFCLISLSLD